MYTTAGEGDGHGGHPTRRSLEAGDWEVVALHCFGGLTHAETAAALGVSEEATVDRDLRMAKAWLATELREGARD